MDEREPRNYGTSPDDSGDPYDLSGRQVNRDEYSVPERDDDPYNRGRGWTWFLFFVLLLAIVFGTWYTAGWGFAPAQRSAKTKTASDENALAVDRSTDLSGYEGKTVTIDGRVSGIISNNSFLLAGAGGEQPLLVVTREKLTEQPINVSAEQSSVKVTGVLKPFDRTQIERESGVRMSESEMNEYKGKWVIYADSISPVMQTGSRETVYYVESEFEDSSRMGAMLS